MAASTVYFVRYFVTAQCRVDYAGITILRRLIIYVDVA